EECRMIAAAAGHPPSPDSLKAAITRLTDAGSAVTASMLGDVERRGRPQGDPGFGGFLRGGGGAPGGGPAPLPGGGVWGDGGGARRRWGSGGGGRGGRGRRAPPDQARWPRADMTYTLARGGPTPRGRSRRSSFGASSGPLATGPAQAQRPAVRGRLPCPSART